MTNVHIHVHVTPIHQTFESICPLKNKYYCQCFTLTTIFVIAEKKIEIQKYALLIPSTSTEGEIEIAVYEF